MKKFHLGLIGRIALVVIAIEVLAFGALGWFYIDRFSRAIAERTYARLHQIGHMIAAEDLPIGMVARPPIMSDLVGLPYLEGMVIGGNGRVIVASNPAQLGRLAAQVSGWDAAWLAPGAPEDRFVARGEALTFVLRPRSAADVAPTYTTVLTVSTAPLVATQRAIAWGGFAGSLLFIVLTSVAIVLFARRLITRRVDQSLRVLKRVEQGELDARIPVTGHDELGLLQRGVNAMTEQLARLLAQQQRHVEALRAQKELLASVIENAPIRVFWKDRDSRIMGCNTQFARDAGAQRPEQLIGKTDEELPWRDQAQAYRADDQQVMASGQPKLDYEEPQTTPEGRTIWLSTSKVPLRDAAGQVSGLLGIYADITERKQAQEQVYRLAYFDALTGLPNRTQLLERLRQTMACCSGGACDSGTCGALLFIDLDDFKAINETAGHDIGDLLLQQAAQRLRASVRPEDMVARAGGDEFLVLLPLQNASEAAVVHLVETVGARMLEALNQNYRLDGMVFHCTASIGATLLHGRDTSVEELLKQADMALYQAKDAGRNALRFFDAEMASAVRARMALEKDLREALPQGQLTLHYQLQVDGAGRATGAEVLLRWQHPQRGMVSPAAFIPLAEKTGLILPIGQWVLHAACVQLAAWAGQPETAQLTLAVNLSAQQLRQADFVAQVLQVLDETGANPQRLKLELTESMLVSNVEDAIEKMQALKARGVRFALDDFGTGYSSLAYLRRLPLDQLKIDQSFVRDVLGDPSAAALAQSIVALAQTMGLGVIAEGVETAEQREFLARVGCHAYQGYHFGRPVPLAEFEAQMQALRAAG
ncbi:putative bifunctional diguanylate cyclase/phosphodiesterase [Extensimonas vulgaris]|uniref:PAS domain S-box-containing protein/diguanylate cyclase (GGDEF)-like protein n=1 Tax=Extensimonas vulgaris TaxID=1031594 RepID=A0A369ARQ0_9BURK|nr:EAL domain-containing protein [Extensimonas vulgaris]RCX10134.1 PAS domain S-box-containing protein/diguanylate cyclase (GGDEF)-like protein [Extensimonas vulgaris]TWI39715.1 PAS domain S-box-containing protein/diguanylate cyclase (GGDEF)-like protein [Extensimonas vulgaris]TXD17283.1 EAL domain-containing protein [Extensimonas vulgaris]